jgi:hypothetical protein
LNISLVTITDGSRLESLKRTVESARGLVDEVVLIYQGRDQTVYSEIQKISDFSIQVAPKGNADPDRNFAYELASKEWILALDDDEHLPDETKAFIARIIMSPTDVVWFRFVNLIDGVDIKDILGDDPHPRLWRKRQGLIDWPAKAHTFPPINSGMQYFTLNPVIHDRKYEDVLARHEARGKVVDPQNAELERNFINAVKSKLRKK